MKREAARLGHLSGLGAGAAERGPGGGQGAVEQRGAPERGDLRRTVAGQRRVVDALAALRYLPLLSPAGSLEMCDRVR